MMHSAAWKPSIILILISIKIKSKLPYWHRCRAENPFSAVLTVNYLPKFTFRKDRMIGLSLTTNMLISGFLIGFYIDESEGVELPLLLSFIGEISLLKLKFVLAYSGDYNLDNLANVFRFILKTVPFPISLSTVTEPPSCSTIALQILKPRPNPFLLSPFFVSSR